METTVEVCPAVVLPPPPDPALVNKAFMEKYVRQVEKWVRRDLAPLIKGDIGTDNGEGISTYADGSNHEYIRTTLFVNTADCCHHITVYRYDDGSSNMHLLTLIEATNEEWEHSFDRISAGAWRSMLWYILESELTLSAFVAKRRVLLDYKEKLKAKKRLE